MATRTKTKPGHQIWDKNLAHNANVNCVALGRKSGVVMVTGGDDMKVNLWAVGKPGCFMNLSGHTTPVDCVSFNQTEELVVSGSRTGALKVWDLEAASLVRTLTGHRDSVRCTDFHPYGVYLASGSADKAIKVWDRRCKGNICNFVGHTDKVNSIKFSPDGYWIASGSDDRTIRLWDMRIGRMLKEFKERHSSAVTTVEFHPHEFLLATGGSDCVVNYFDLENFNLVSSEKEVGLVRCMYFNPEGDSLFVGVRDYLKVLGWEPSRLYDSVNLEWGRVHDISIAQNKVIGASFHLTKVFVHLVDLNTIRPFGGQAADAPQCFTPNTSLRKSFSRAERPVSLVNRLDVKTTIEESTSGTDPEEESTAAITNQVDYEEIFRPGRALVRTPPPPTEPQSILDAQIEHDVNEDGKILDPQILEHSFEALSLDHNINYSRGSPPPTPPNTAAYARSKSNLDQVYSNRGLSKNDQNKAKSMQPPRYQLQRQSSCKDGTANSNNKQNSKSNNIRHSVSEVNLNKNSAAPQQTRNNLRKNSFSKISNNQNSNSNVSKIPMTSRQVANDVNTKPMNIFNSEPVDIYVKNKLSPDEEVRTKDFIPVSIDRPVGLQFDDFLPKNHDSFSSPPTQNMSEAEVLNIVMGGHDNMLKLLYTRERHLQLVAKQLERDVKMGLEFAANLNDLAVIVDILGVINHKHSLWSLDSCVLLLPKIEELIESKFESYMTTGCDSLRLILRNFGSVIKTNSQYAAGSFGVDISREERHQRACMCAEFLEGIRLVIYKKQAYTGKVGNAFKEVAELLQSTLD